MSISKLTAGRDSEQHISSSDMQHGDFLFSITTKNSLTNAHLFCFKMSLLMQTFLSKVGMVSYSFYNQLSICYIFAVADTGFEKEWGAPTQNFQINGFWPEFYFYKKGGARAPAHPSKSATGHSPGAYGVCFLLSPSIFWNVPFI